MEDAAGRSPAPERGRLQSSASILARGIDHRTELASIELSEARDDAVAISALLIGGVVAGVLAGVALNLLVAAIWWDTTHRVRAISLSLTVQIVVAISVFALGRRRLRLWHPLASTIDQLKKDAVCVRDLIANPRS
jgi:uncharacterized membrane protein YqjE